MGGEFPVRTYWIYVAIAVPITTYVLGVLVLLVVWEDVGRLGRKQKAKRWVRNKKVFKGGAWDVGRQLKQKRSVCSIIVYLIFIPGEMHDIVVDVKMGM